MAQYGTMRGRQNIRRQQLERKNYVHAYLSLYMGSEILYFFLLFVKHRRGKKPRAGRIMRNMK